MRANSQRLASYLTHILDAIRRIEAYTAGVDGAAFLAETLVQDAVIRNLEIMGEASHLIATRFPSFAERHPDLPLGEAYQMRNALAHGYFQVDLDLVWKTVVADLPALSDRIADILATEFETGD